jgi:hypothetical protein
VVDTGERCDLGPPQPNDGGGNGTGVGCNATCSLLEVVTTIGGFVCDDGGVVACQGHVDGPGAQSEFYFPRGITIVSEVAYIADEFNNVIRTIDLSTDIVGTLAGSGAHKTIDGTGDAGAFFSPLGITALQGNLFVAESTDVRQVTLSRQVTTLTGLGNGKSGFTDGPFSTATFGFVSGLEGIATDGVNLYVSDPPNIRVLDMDAGVVSTLETLDGGQSNVNDVPSGLVFLKGLLYTVDQGSSIVESLNPNTGAVTLLAGTPGGGSLVDGTGPLAVFNVPTGICTDGQTLYVADEGNDALRQVDPATGVVTTVAGSGATKNLDGTGRQAELAAPAGCAFDPATGDIIVTEQLGNAIRRIH